MSITARPSRAHVTSSTFYPSLLSILLLRTCTIRKRCRSKRGISSSLAATSLPSHVMLCLFQFQACLDYFQCVHHALKLLLVTQNSD